MCSNFCLDSDAGKTIHKQMVMWLKQKLKEQSSQEKSNLPKDKNCQQDNGSNSTKCISDNKPNANHQKLIKNNNLNNNNESNKNLVNATNNTINDNSDNYMVNNNDLNRISENEVLIPIMNMQNILQGDDSLLNGQASDSPICKYREWIRQPSANGILNND